MEKINYEVRFYSNSGKILIEETHYQNCTLNSSGRDTFGRYIYSIGKTKLQAVHNLRAAVSMYMKKLQNGYETLTNIETDLLKNKEN